MVKQDGNNWHQEAILGLFRKPGNVCGAILKVVAAVSLGAVVLLTGCQTQPAVPTRQVAIQQGWELETGDWVGGYLVTASLGDVSIRLNGDMVRAPFSGEVELAADAPGCVYFSSPEVPAYLFRFCGLRRPKLGQIQLGAVMGSSQIVHFATLRRQPDGTWAIVEPSSHVLERALQSY